MALAIQKIDKAIRDAGIPIHGIDGTGQNAKIQFTEEATQEQRDEGLTLLAAFDWQDDPPPPEYQKKRAELQTEFPIEIQVESIYKVAKNLRHYVENGITPDINAKPGTPEHWVAWQDEIREKVPKPDAAVGGK